MHSSDHQQLNCSVRPKPAETGIELPRVDFVTDFTKITHQKPFQTNIIIAIVITAHRAKVSVAATRAFVPQQVLHALRY